MVSGPSSTASSGDPAGMNPIAFPIQLLLLVAASVVGVWLLIKTLAGLGWVLAQVFKFIATVLGRIGAFIVGMGTDALRVVGGSITAVFFVPFIVSNIALGRWSRANHYGKALEREAMGVGTSAYRLAIGHVGRLLGLTSLTDGIERRIPEAMARAPAPDSPRGRTDSFDGYTIVGSLPSGGSGARLYLAEPLPDKREQLTRSGRSVSSKVVIKSFSLADGSTMPQIVRESRALEAARNMGLVLEHELSASRFHYVMPYVPGDDLTLVTQRLHDQAGTEGLGPRQVGLTLNYVSDLLQTMQRFHSAGLWHKDIKPSNIIVSEGRVHLVDLGLTTPLSSAMTLTTHGTEYFRDPELVRLALRGVKVQEVDGVKFDIYGAGAVLYSVIENGFPAHGSLSQIHKRCPEALRWIVRRAMADMNNRYGSATEMLADIRAVMAAHDPFAVTPASLPSMSGDRSMLHAVAAEVADEPDMPPLPNSPQPIPTSRDRASVAASSRSGGLRWGAAAALVLMGVIGLGAGFVLLAPMHSVSTQSDVANNDPGAWPRTILLGSLDSSPSSQRVGRAPAGQDTGVAGSAYTAPSPSAASATAAVLAQHRPEPKTILIIDDLGPSLGKPRLIDIENLYQVLEAARFELAGVGRSNPLTQDQEWELLGAVRLLIGQSTAWDADMCQRLDEWLRQTHPRVSAVLRLANGDLPGQVACQFVAVDDADGEDLMELMGVADPPTTASANAGSRRGVISFGIF